MWAMMFTAGEPAISISDATASSSTVTPTNAVAQYELTSAGDIRRTNGTNTVVDVGDWIAPKTLMSNYEAMMTNTAGTAPSGASLATWLNLGTTRTWTISRTTVGSTVSTNTLQIRRAADGTVFDTATISFDATKD